MGNDLRLSSDTSNWWVKLRLKNSYLSTEEGRSQDLVHPKVDAYLGGQLSW